MKANQRSPPPRGRPLAPVGMPVESAFTRFFAYVVARIVRGHQTRSYPGNIELNLFC
jgi:hypothetical protein